MLLVCGPNGCGKTTLLRLFANLQLPSQGTITLNGKILEEAYRQNHPGIALDVNRSFYWRLTVADNLRFFAKLLGIANREAKIFTEEWVNKFQLSDHLHSRVGMLSAGQRQRLGLIRALIGKPKVVLLDEPLCHLDDASREYCIECFKDLRNSEHPPILIATSTTLKSDLRDQAEQVLELPSVAQHQLRAS